MGSRDLSHLGAGRTRRLGKRQKSADLLDAESKLAGAADERQPSYMAFFIGPMPAPSVRAPT
jgi:hypothetical protein